jgi:uncharacterized protein with HEPN domain
MSKRDPALYAEDMLVACNRVQEYTRGFSRERFLSDTLVSDAVVRNLEVIGEAARHVPDELRARFADIPWRSIVAFRNIAIHAYGSVSLERVWAIVTEDIPALAPRLRQMLETLDRESA